jgi:hypothetical protein
MAETGAETKETQKIVERAVEQVLAHQLPQLQSELVQRVLAALPAPASETSASSDSDIGSLLAAVGAIHAGTTQKEILRALLDGGIAYSARIALFVVKAGAATGWQSRGFGDDDPVKDFALDMNAGPVAHAYQSRSVAPANIAEIGARFVDQFGTPANEQILILPLVLKDKIAALVYADGGASGAIDAASLELLVVATSAWLEVISLRKQVQQPAPHVQVARESETPVERSAPAAPPVQTISSFSDPFASHTPKHIAPKAPEPEPEPAAEVVEVASSPSVASAAAAPATAADPFAGLSAEDADMHRKAQRFARLLVDEIKLYNQAKVAEGRRHKDVYDRLKSEIEQSRSTYEKRYGNTAAASASYFQQEVVRSLAEDDLSLMGANFKP